MERLRATPESYDRKIEFLRTAVAEKAYRKAPVAQRFKEQSWIRMRNIGAIYNGSSSATYDSLGKQYGLTRERIRQINKKFIEYLWENCSQETKNEFPLNTIPLDKPTSQVSREKRSQEHGGRTLRVRKEVESGVTDRDQIAKNLGLSAQDVGSSWRILRRWGVDVPFERRRQSYQEIKNKIEKETDDKKLQELLDGFSAGLVMGMTAYYKNSDQAIFMYLGNVLRELGFNRRVRFFADVLKSAGIPMRRVERGSQIKRSGRKYPLNYYVFLAKHKQRVIDAIRVITVMQNNEL